MHLTRDVINFFIRREIVAELLACRKFLKERESDSEQRGGKGRGGGTETETATETNRRTKKERVGVSGRETHTEKAGGG